MSSGSSTLELTVKTVTAEAGAVRGAAPNGRKSHIDASYTLRCTLALFALPIERSPAMFLRFSLDFSRKSQPRCSRCLRMNKTGLEIAVCRQLRSIRVFFFDKFDFDRPNRRSKKANSENKEWWGRPDSNRGPERPRLRA